jgi:CYTH domain-containing protein
MKRKFLIKNKSKFSDCIKTAYIEEAYISEFSNIKIRMESDAYSKRKLSTKYMMVITSCDQITGMENIETKDISYNTYADLSNNKIGKKIEKLRRYYKLDNNLIAKLDEFQSIPDLKIVEIKFDNEEDANSFIVPEWFGEEITFNSKYENRNLSLIF